jgi:predicted nucleic acid-binding Zn ribbon protein
MSMKINEEDRPRQFCSNQCTHIMLKEGNLLKSLESSIFTLFFTVNLHFKSKYYKIENSKRRKANRIYIWEKSIGRSDSRKRIH